MGHNRSHALLVTLGMAAGAFGAAALISVATARTARADDLTDLISAIDGDFTAGQAGFADALTDFSSNMVPAGLTSFFEGVNDDLWAPENNLLLLGSDSVS
jgi:hypothetical protein